MVTALIDGQIEWSMTRDEDGHREYKLVHYIRADRDEGPAAVLSTPGLPLPGSPWIFDNDTDPWAYCKFDATIQPVQTKEPNMLWTVEQTFTTKPYKECKDMQFEDPLLEPQKVSGTYNKKQVEAAFDKNNLPIRNSSFERVRGQQIEFDESMLVVRVEQNVAALQLDTLEYMKDRVNMYPLWGFPARCIKLSSIQWERKYHGMCYIYYTRSFEFEIAYDLNDLTFPSKHDRKLMDEGTKVLNGKWDPDGVWRRKKFLPEHRLNPDENGNVLSGTAGGDVPLNPNPFNPQHYIRYKDRYDENTRVVLDGYGMPAGENIEGVSTGTGTGQLHTREPGIIYVQKYLEADFVLLGIPIYF